MIGACQFSIRPNGATFWRSSMIATVAPPPSSPARSPSNIGTKLSATPPSATPSWIASFTTLTAFNSPEKACEKRTPAIKLLTQTQTPEPITASVKATAHDRAKYLLTIACNRRSPSAKCAPWKQPAPRSRRPPPGTQQFEQIRRQHYVPVFAAFALLDADHHALAVDVADLQRHHLGDA